MTSGALVLTLAAAVRVVDRFIAVPRTLGLMPCQRLRPAFPPVMLL